MIKDKLMIETSILIHASNERVWHALVTPSIMKKYLMDSNVTSDWKVGSPITYEGEYQGKKYKDKGVIQKIQAPTLFQSTYWNSMSGKEDKPENYTLLSFRLSLAEGKTKLTVDQDNISSEKERDQLTSNWNAVLAKLKEVVEKG
jgi:uncharacterized protein YndB with AHSA1/START domain